MGDDVISVLTYKSTETILDTGGTQSWALNPTRARACRYALLCRNAHTRDAEDRKPHGTAFMVGRVSGVVPSTDHDGRWLILFSEYALCEVADQWEGRNPVAYRSVNDYPAINFDALDFQNMPGGKAPPLSPPAAGLTIAEAKRGLAESLGVQPGAIEITIRG